MVREADLERAPAGLVPASEGWFVVNAREARWIDRPGRGVNLPFTGWTEQEAETWFPQLGVALIRLEPGEPIGMYHREADAEDLLILAGEALLLVEEQAGTTAETDDADVAYAHVPEPKPTPYREGWLP